MAVTYFKTNKFLAIALIVILSGCSETNNKSKLDRKGYIKLQNISTKDSPSFEKETSRVIKRVKKAGS